MNFELFSILMLLASTINCQDFCYEQGECIDGTAVDISPGESDYNTCLDFCKITALCNYFTYNHDAFTCFAFTTCPTLSTDSCIDCHSGEVTCNHYRQCAESGQCIGTHLHTETRENQYHCIAMCHEITGCLYYTYYTSTNSCSAFGSCVSVNTDCSDCYSGEASCGNIDPAENYNIMMVVGGNGANYDVEVIDLSGQLRTCDKPPKTPSDVALGSTGAFYDGSVIICGGYYAGINSDKCYRYDHVGNSWVNASSLRVPSRCAEGAFLSWDQWWITGGIDDDGGLNAEGTSESLPSGKTSFNTDIDLPEAFYHHTMVRINDTSVILVNGATTANDHVVIYDDVTKSFSPLPSLPVGRYAPCAGLVKYRDGTKKILVTGGQSSFGYQSSTISLDLSNPNQWGNEADLPQALERGASVPFRNSFLVVGGFKNEGAEYYSDFIYEFDPDDSNAWITRTERLTVGRYNPAAFLISDVAANCHN